MILACPRVVTKMFAGLMSRWMIWFPRAANLVFPQDSKDPRLLKGFEILGRALKRVI
jgi:hypothetical protein